MTATERVYQQWLNARTDDDKKNYEGQLAAICIHACRKVGLVAPFHYGYRFTRRIYRSPEQINKAKSMSAGIDTNPFWAARFRSLAPWVYAWVNAELGRQVPLSDGARYIGRRCINALKDEIRRDQRRRRGAQVRCRPQDDDAFELDRMRSGMRRVLAEADVTDKVNIPGDRALLERLMAAYPRRLSNVELAREDGVSEGAIRKRRKRLGAMLFGVADGNYQLRSVLRALGLKEGTKNAS
jgi:hypothetical protein